MVITPPTAQAVWSIRPQGLPKNTFSAYWPIWAILTWVELLHVIVVVLAAQDGTDADLKGCGAGQTGAAQHVAGGVAVKAAHLAACIHNALGYAADQGRGVLGLARLRNEVGDIDIVNFVKAQGLDADDIFLIRGDDGHHIQVDRTCQHHTVVVVGVVAADLCAAPGAE